MPDPKKPGALEPDERQPSAYTPSEQPIMTDGQLGTVETGPERANPEGSSDLSNLVLVGRDDDV